MLGYDVLTKSMLSLLPEPIDLEVNGCSLYHCYFGNKAMVGIQTDIAMENSMKFFKKLGKKEKMADRKAWRGEA